MTCTVAELVRFMNTLAPFSSAEPWDNVGLLIGSGDEQLTGILVTLDVTPEAVKRAAALHCSAIVSHHPVIFNALKRLPADSVPALCLKNGLTVVSAHTNYDFAPEGVNRALAEALGLRNIRPFGPADPQTPYFSLVTFVPRDSAEAVYEALSKAGAGMLGNYSGCGFLGAGEGRFLPLEGASPAIGRVGTPERVEELRLEMLVAPEALSAVVAALKATHPYEEPAYSVFPNYAVTAHRVYGMMGELPHPHTARELALLTERALSTRVAYTDPEKPLLTVAVTGGAGSDFMGDALAAGADAFLTGEVKHHEWFPARERGLCLLAGGHYATEEPAMPHLTRQLTEAFPGLPVYHFASEPTHWT